MEIKPQIDHADFHISYKCNNRCVFCSESLNLGLGPEMELPPEVIFAKLKELHTRGVRNVLFTGGEPFLNPALPAIIGNAFDMGMKVSVSTNGTAVDLDVFRAIAPKISQIIISYHAHTADLHEAITGNREGFERRKELLAEMKNHVGKIFFLANIVLTRLNIGVAMEVITDALEQNIFKLILLSNLAPEGRGLDSYTELAPRLCEVADVASRVKDLVRSGNVEMHVFGMPFCALGIAGANSNDMFWYPRVTVERRPPEAGSASPELMESESWNATRKRCKPNICLKCRCNADCFCGGVFTAYADAFGCEELKPIGAIGSAKPQSKRAAH